MAPSYERLMSEAGELARTPVASLLDFADAACVVTGGASGIGRSIATRFAQAGAAVSIVDLSSDRDAAAADVAEQTGGDVVAVSADVRDLAALEAVAGAALGRRRRLVWVNAAGIYPTHRLEDLTEEAWEAVIGIDLTGTFNGSRAAGLALRRADATGVIVNISSTAGSRAGWPPGIAHYVSAKHAVEALTKALAVELGPFGIRVVCLAPGTVLTEGLRAKFGEATGADDPYARLARRMPIARPSLPDDVARMALVCASPIAAMLTGCTIPVDGGHLAT